MARRQRNQWFASTQCRRKRSSKKKPRRALFETLEARNMLSLSVGAPLDLSDSPLEDEHHHHGMPHSFYASPEDVPAEHFNEFNARVPWLDQDPFTDGVQLTYSYSNFLDGTLDSPLSVEELRAATEEALGLWASVAPLHFQEVLDSGPSPVDPDIPDPDGVDYDPAGHPNIRIGHHFIDGTGSVLAHAFFPVFDDSSGLAGDVHFDSGDSWGNRPPDTGDSFFDTIEVMTHELGHSLGLGHESAVPAIMNPFIQGLFSGPGTGFLFADDINGIQALYGEGVGSVTPLVPLVVDTLVDESDGNFGTGDFSLREAIERSLASGGSQIVDFSETLEGGTILLDSPLVIDGAIVIQGLGAELLTIQANDPSGALGDGFQLFTIDDGDSELSSIVNISGMTLTGGDSGVSGGAISSAEALTLDDVNLHGNHTQDEGGAIFSTGLVQLFSSTVADSTAVNDGGGIHTAGGINVESSTISGNTSGDEGGGISVEGEGTEILFTSSTLSGNTAAGNGGGMHVLDLNPTKLRVVHSTVTGNSSGASGGGIYEYNGVLVLDHSIIAGNTDTASAPDIDNINLFAAPAVLVKNSLVGNSNGSVLTLLDFNSQIGTAAIPINPLLGTLADNGGPTETHLLQSGSPALNAGDPSILAPPEFDQRGLGFSRIISGVIDLGAAEAGGFNTTFTVDTLADENDGDFSAGDLSLREAIFLSGQEQGDDLINFDESLGGGVINLSAALGELLINGSMTIDAGDLISGLTIDASQADPTPTLNNGDGIRLLRVDDGSAATKIDVTIIGIEFIGGDVTGHGGAVFSEENLTLQFVSVLESSAKDGHGGGIYHKDGSLIIENSTVAGNEAIGDVLNPLTTGDGGGLWTNTTLVDPTTARVTHSTFSGNTAADEGGGIFNFDGKLAIEHSTITSNTAVLGGGVVSFGDALTQTTVQSTIIAGNNGLDTQKSKNLGANSFVSLGYNLIGFGNAILNFDNNDQVEVADPGLGPLGNNGGSTSTHAPIFGSPAVDAGDPAVTSLTYTEEVLSHSPIIYWNLDEDSGTTVQDAVGNLNGELATSGVSLNAAGAAVQTGTSASFDGSSGFIKSENTLIDFDLQENYSVSLWFNANTDAGTQTLFVLNRLTSAIEPTEFGVTLWPGGGIRFHGTFGSETANAFFQPGQWHHLAMVREGSEHRIYLDGDLDKAETIPSAPLALTELFLGRDGFDSFLNPLDGFIDDFALYDRSLSDQDVADLFDAASNPSTNIIMNDQRGAPFVRVLDGDRDSIAVIDVGAVEFVPPEPISDFDQDTTTDGGDFLSWQRGFGITEDATLADGDSDFDGDVDGDDLAVWQQNFGSVGPATIVISPEVFSSEPVGAIPATVAEPTETVAVASLPVTRFQFDAVALAGRQEFRSVQLASTRNLAQESPNRTIESYKQEDFYRHLVFEGIVSQSNREVERIAFRRGSSANSPIGSTEAFLLLDQAFAELDRFRF